MKKIFLVTILASSMWLISGCSAPPKNETKNPPKAIEVSEPVSSEPKFSEEQPACVFPDAPKIIAPTWVCDAPVEGVAISAVGSYEKSNAGYQFMKDQASASARINLAQAMRQQVSNMIKQFLETTGQVSSETVDRVNTNVTKAITSETIYGARVYRSITSPKGSVYVLVGLDPKIAQQQARDAIRSSLRSDQAAWQRFKAKEAQEEMNEEIEKRFPDQR